MDWVAAKVLVEIAIFFLNGVLLFFLFQWKRQSADRHELDDLSLIVTRHDEQLKGVPTQAEIADLRVGMAEVKGSVEALAAETHGIRDLLPPLQNSINLINGWMLKQK